MTHSSDVSLYIEIWVSKSKPSTGADLLPIYYFSTVETEAKYSCETSVDFHIHKFTSLQFCV
jgi:hypothetical protein